MVVAHLATSPFAVAGAVVSALVGGGLVCARLVRVIAGADRSTSTIVETSRRIRAGSAAAADGLALVAAEPIHTVTEGAVGVRSTCLAQSQERRIGIWRWGILGSIRAAAVHTAAATCASGVTTVRAAADTASRTGVSAISDTSAACAARDCTVNGNGTIYRGRSVYGDNTVNGQAWRVECSPIHARRCYGTAAVLVLAAEQPTGPGRGQKALVPWSASVIGLAGRIGPRRVCAAREAASQGDQGKPKHRPQNHQRIGSHLEPPS